MENLRLGFIGLGEMGTPMARNLLQKGFKLTLCGHHRRQSIEDLKELNAEEAQSPREVAETSDIIILMLRDIPQTDEVFWGQDFWKEQGIWQGMQSGSTIILCSTLKPDYCQKIADKSSEKGVFVLDSPVSGGYPQADAGTLTFMVGGNSKALNHCLPVLKAMGENIYYLGGSGMGQAMKLVNNYMMIVNAHGTSEAVALGLKAGLGLEQMLEIIKVSSGNSAVIQRWNILAQHHQEFKETQPGRKSIFNKDIELAVDFAGDIGVKTDFGKLVLKSDESLLFPT